MDFNRQCPQLLRQRCRGAQLRFSHSGTVGLSGLPMEPCSPGSPVTPLRSFRTGKSYLAEMCSARALPWFGHLCNLCVSHWKPYKNCSKRCVHTIYVQLTTLALSLSLSYSMKLDWYDVVILWTCACISKSLVHTYLSAFCFFWASSTEGSSCVLPAAQEYLYYASSQHVAVWQLAIVRTMIQSGESSSRSVKLEGMVTSDVTQTLGKLCWWGMCFFLPQPWWSTAIEAIMSS